MTKNKEVIGLRTQIADRCSEILNVKCDADMVTVGTKHSDIMLRVAFFYDIDINHATNLLETKGLMLFGQNAVKKVCADGKYINITLADEFLELLADKIITEYPLPDVIGDDYATERAYTLSRQSGFSCVFTNREARTLFLELVKCTPSALLQVKQNFLKVQANMGSYSGFGKVADVALRVFYLCGKENEK